MFKNTVSIIFPLLKLQSLCSLPAFFSYSGAFTAVCRFNMRSDADSRQTAHQREWQEGCELLRSSTTGIVHSAIQGKELHEVALIMMMCFILPCGEFLFTLVLLQGLQRSWSAAEQEVQCLGQRHYSSVYAFQTIRPETPNLTKPPLLSSTGWIWLTLRFGFLLLNK